MAGRGLMGGASGATVAAVALTALLLAGPVGGAVPTPPGVATAPSLVRIALADVGGATAPLDAPTPVPPGADEWTGSAITADAFVAAGPSEAPAAGRVMLAGLVGAAAQEAPSALPPGETPPGLARPSPALARGGEWDGSTLWARRAAAPASRTVAVSVVVPATSGAWAGSRSAMPVVPVVRAAGPAGIADGARPSPMPAPVSRTVDPDAEAGAEANAARGRWVGASERGAVDWTTAQHRSGPLSRAGPAITLVAPADVIDPPPRAPAPRAAPSAETAPRPMPTRIVMDRDRGGGARAAEPALAAGAAPFDADGRPLLALVLFEDRRSAAAVPAGVAVTVAIDPTVPDAPDRAAGHRAAGREVVLTDAAMPVGSATPQEVEVAFAAAARAVPGAVGVLAPGFGTAADHDAAVAMLAETGHALVTPPGRLGPQSAARRAGIPVAGARRVIDGAGEDADAITYHLERAAFDATRDGSAVVIGTTRARTLAAIARWMASERGGVVQVAPLSAILEPQR